MTPINLQSDGDYGFNVKEDTQFNEINSKIELIEISINKRIFMFIDMKDSTTHAEQLGHVKFTHLIQDCFRDFGIIAEKWEWIYINMLEMR